MNSAVHGGLVIQEDGNNIKAWGIAREEDSGLILHALADQSSGALQMRDHDILVRREDSGMVVAIYRGH